MAVGWYSLIFDKVVDYFSMAVAGVFAARESGRCVVVAPEVVWEKVAALRSVQDGLNLL